METRELKEAENENHRYIVKFKHQHDFELIDFQLQNKADPRRIMSLPLDRAEVMNFETEGELNYWDNRADVEYIEPDYKVYLQAERVPYGINLVQALQISDARVSNQKVCIIDTGYDINHLDLPQASNIVSGTSQVTSQAWTTDGDGHGTHVAGTIAAIGGNNQGVIGINRNGQIKLHIVKVFDNDGRWTFTSNLIQAVESCVQAGSTVINMSLGGGGNSITERNAFERIYNDDNVLLVAAAGNGGDNSKLYPASYSSVISVAAIDSSKSIAWFSQYNNEVDLAAPGVAVESTFRGGGFRKLDGTSMASPHVAGVAALVWSHFPNLSAKQIRSALELSAEDLGEAGRDDQYGHGLVRADLAYKLLVDSNGGTDGGDGNTCEDSPIGWYDSDGTSFNCKWYEEKQKCDSYGSGDLYKNFGKNAAQACCACGGGSTSSPVEPSVPSPTQPVPTPTPPTPTPPTPLPPSPTPSTCIDTPKGWYDNDGSTFNCQWYEEHDYCERFGNSYPGVNGKTANEACCSCGGGTRTNEPGPTPPPPVPVPSPPTPPSNGGEFKCGCSSCSEAILNEDIAGNGFKLGDQIEWLKVNFGYSETNACHLLCGDLFQNKCDECNPTTCRMARK